jgi:hypothetical protein
LLAIGIASLWALLVHLDREAARQREALALFSQSVRLGMSRDEADRTCKQACVQNRGWDYRASIGQAGISAAVVETPLTFGARNWVVYLVFEKDVVAAVLVRTADSPREKPGGSPRDRIAELRAPWLARFSSLPRS